MPDAKTPFVLTRLSIMMFLQFFVWGAWYVSMTGFMKMQGMGDLIAAAYTVAPIAAVVSPFFLGLIADRFFSSERVLGGLHIVGGALIFAAPMVARPYDPATDGSPFMQPYTLILLAHMLCYMPTMAITVSLSFHNLENQEKQFPLVRVLGTIGWIVGNIAVSFLADADQSPQQFYLAGGAGILLGLYSFSLPHTPPPMKGKKMSVSQVLGLDALKLLAKPSYAVFIVCSFLICIPLAGYYQLGRTFVEEAGAIVNDSATFTMSFGQMSEILFMLVMPLFFVRLGVKWMLLVGMLAWVVRYALFALGADDSVMWMIMIGILLHGICYDFFFVTGMIYVDKAAPKEIRGQAQGFLVLVTQGLGLGIGAQVIGRIVTENTTDGVADWQTIWLIPCLMAAAIAVLFFLFFRNNGAGSKGQAESDASPS